MNAQRRDLISSRYDLEQDGERFGCMICGESLGTVEDGNTSDVCDACTEEI